MEEGAKRIRATSILPGEVATPILEKEPGAAAGATSARACCRPRTSQDDPVHRDAARRACGNEIIISPTWNRFYLGGLETPKS